MLQVGDLMSEPVRDALRRPRALAYLEKADAFACKALPQRLGGLEDAARKAVIQSAYLQGAERGLASDGDQMAYLVAVAHLGLFFETDPQYATLRTAAGWNEGDGARDLSRLAAEIDRYRTEVEEDLADLPRLVTAFERLFTVSAVDDGPKACAAFMARCFPRRAARFSGQAGPAFVASARSRALSYGLSGPDLVAHVALALYFGHHFAEDPQHPWVLAAYQEEQIQDRRLALGAGMQAYLARFTPDARGRMPKERL